MIKIDSPIDGKQLPLSTLKKALEPIGFVVGGGWEYDHAHLDYMMGDLHGDQQYLRIPLQSMGDSLEDDRAAVMIGTPFLLDHQFKTEVDDEGDAGAATGLNQFKSPENKDAPFPEEFKEEAMAIMQKVEEALEGQHSV
ncbi:YugN family protein [Peribacillus sp. SCS-37]|uniref:YugN family protein n=1 Tax=Paraperibacillus esterisolvens TaxID=3115296 RepID=UPI00390662DF